MGAPEKIDIAASHRTRIGCSNIAQALGLSRWGTAYELWERYTGRADWPDIGGELRVALGEPMESVLKPFAEFRLGGQLRRDRTEYAHPTLPIVGHMDFRLSAIAQAAIDALGRPANVRPVVDMKTSLGFGARHRFGADGSDEVDDDVLIQMQGYTMLSGAELAFVVALVPGPELKVYTIRADQELHRLIEDGIGEFWHRVQTDTPPDPQNEAEARQRWARHIEGKTAEASQDLRQDLLALKDVKAKIKAAEREEQELKDRIIPALQDLDALTWNGVPICSYRANKDAQKVDWKSLMDELAPPAELIAKHTITTPGARILRLAKALEA